MAEAPRTIYQHFNTEAIQEYQPVQLKNARQLLGHLRQDPTNFLRLVNFVIGAGIIEIVYGHHVQDPNNPYLVLSRNGSAAASEGLIPGAFLVEFFPFLRHIPTLFPGAAFKRKAADWKKTFRAMVEVPFKDAKTAVVRISEMTSMLSKLTDLPGKRLRPALNRSPDACASRRSQGRRCNPQDGSGPKCDGRSLRCRS